MSTTSPAEHIPAIPASILIFNPPITANRNLRAITEDGLVSILQDLARGFTLHETCRTHNVKLETIVSINATDPVFATHYARARRAGIDHMADRSLTLAQEAYESAPRDFSGRADPAAIQAAKITADAFRWYCGKMAPKVWGDRVEVEHSGSIQVDVSATLAQLSDEALERLVAFRALLPSAREPAALAVVDVGGGQET